MRSANFTLTIADNNVVVDGHTSPPASQWRFNISAQGGSPSFTCTMTITGPTQNITSQIQACAAPLPTPKANSFAFDVVQQSATPSFTGNGNTVFWLTLNQNVTSSAFITSAAAGLSPVYYVNVCQDGVGGWNMVWPTNVRIPDNYTFKTTAGACSPVAFAYNPNNSTWTPWEDRTGGGGGGPGITVQVNGTTTTVQSLLNLIQGTGITITSDAFGGVTITNTAASTTGTAGVLQKTDGSGNHVASNITETGTKLTVDDNTYFKGPVSPWLDITRYGGYIGPNYNAAATTCTIAATSTSASCAAASDFANGHGILIPGAGPAPVICRSVRRASRNATVSGWDDDAQLCGGAARLCGWIDSRKPGGEHLDGPSFDGAGHVHDFRRMELQYLDAHLHADDDGGAQHADDFERPHEQALRTG